MNYTTASQKRTYKIVSENKLTDEDITWLRAIKNVNDIEMHKNYITVATKIVDSITEIVKSINCKFCNSSTPKLRPLF
jgi:hypothetical protein